MNYWYDILCDIIIASNISIIIFVLVKKICLDNMSKPYKIVVFDLDETLGYFTQLSILWDAIQKIIGIQDEDHFFEIVDLYPEFLRPKILHIIKYIKDRRNDGSCDKVMIYTNNNGPSYWARMIANYFDNRVGMKIFDQIIAAFKVHDKKVEICRTSHGKSVSDLFKCTKLPDDTQICFIDDKFHQDMKANNVYYIYVKPYIHSMRFDTMVERYYDHFVPTIKRMDFVRDVTKYMINSKYTHIDKTLQEKEVDEVISKQILLHFDDFFERRKSFERGKSITKKRRIVPMNRTRSKFKKNIQ